MHRDIKAAERGEVSCRYIQCKNDADSTAKALDVIRKDETDIIFVILQSADKAGHKYGFLDEVNEYVNACRAVDEEAAKFIEAAERVDGENIDRLIVITTDHGGIGRRHGGQSPDERSTWAAFSKKIPKE